MPNKRVDTNSLPFRVEIAKHESFKPSDFSFKDFSLQNIGFYLAAYLIISLFFVGIGSFLVTLPDFWRGVLLGSGISLMVAFGLFGPKPRKIDVAAPPQPSAEVRAKCDDPSCSLVEAVKAYRDETGLGLFEAKAFVDSYRASKRHLE